MARKPKSEVLEDPPTSIDPYKVLGLEEKATEDQVKSAYRKQALKHHPDKAAAEDKEAANQKFQEIAFAYAILSDARRRKRYDATGNTSESLNLEDDNFNWADFFKEQTEAMVDAEKIVQFKNEFQGSPEEKEALLAAYTKYKGNMDAIYQKVMCSNVLDDDDRFRRMIDEAIAAKEVDAYPRYTNESEASKRRRIKEAKNEGAEAMELAEELGVKEKLFGKEKGKDKAGKKDADESALMALIQQRQKVEPRSFGGTRSEIWGGKKTKRKANDEPPEEAFQKNAKSGKTRK